MDNAENVFTSGEIFDFLNDVVDHEHGIGHAPDVKLVPVDEEDSDYNSEKGTRSTSLEHSNSDRHMTQFVELEVPMLKNDQSHSTGLPKTFVRPRRIELVPQIKLPQRPGKIADVQVVTVPSSKSNSTNGRPHSDLPNTSLIPERSIYDFAFVCQWCPHAFKQKSELDAHFIARHNQPFTCPTCHMTFRDQHHCHAAGTVDPGQETAHPMTHQKPPISEDASGTVQRPLLALVRKSSNGTSLVLKIGNFYYPTCKERYNHQLKECVQRCSNRSCKFRAKVKIIKDVSPESVEYFNIENFDVIEKPDAQEHTCTPLTLAEYLKITKNEQAPVRGVKRKAPRAVVNGKKNIKDKNIRIEVSSTPIQFGENIKNNLAKEELCEFDLCKFHTRIPCANFGCNRRACQVAHSYIFCIKCRTDPGQGELDRSTSAKKDYCSDYAEGFCKNWCDTLCMNTNCRQLICVKHSTKLCQTCVDMAKRKI